jgi:hypothetical protein
LQDNSHFEILIDNVKFDFDAGLKLNQKGYLDLDVQSCDFSFGKSYFHHDNIIFGFLTNQIIEFGKVVIENSIYFVGKYIFNSLLGPEIDSMLGHYQIDF